MQVKSEVEGAQYIVKTGHRNLLPFIWEGDWLIIHSIHVHWVHTMCPLCLRHIAHSHVAGGLCFTWSITRHSDMGSWERVDNQKWMFEWHYLNGGSNRMHLMPGAASVAYIDSGLAFCRAWEYHCCPKVKLLMHISIEWCKARWLDWRARSNVTVSIWHR